MAVDSDMEDVDATTTEVFKILMEKTRNGDYDSFILVTKFTPAYKGKIDVKLGRSVTGTRTMFGDQQHLSLNLVDIAKQLTAGMSPRDKGIVLAMLIQAIAPQQIISPIIL